MKYNTFVVLLAMALASCSKSSSATNTDTVLLHTVDQMNVKPEPLNSHAGEEMFSVLEPVYEYMQVIPKAFLKTEDTAIYPRIKKMKNNKYILFCQGGQIASRIYYYISEDLKTWSEGKLLFEPYSVTTSEGKDTRRFSTADAVVLENGDLLVACSYRANSGYKNNIGCGIAVKRSRDNGLTWSGEETIFEGANWEPYLLQLPDGRVQCYFTDCLPATQNSGTSIVSSTDNGNTWGGHMRVCRQYKYDANGVQIFTDQMPCFRLLNDGNTLFGFLEARLEPDGPQGTSKYMMSLVYNNGFDWTPLGESGVGPEDRDTNVLDGCAGYVTTFPSGETLISSNIDKRFSMKIGDHKARKFNGSSWEKDWFQPFSGSGFWGSTERMDTHHVIGAMHCTDGIQIGVFYLNHRIDAPQANVNVDGESIEWETDQALFIGSDSQAQTIFRASHDKDYLYLLAERKDILLSTSSTIKMYVSHAGPEGSEAGTVVLAEVNPFKEFTCSSIGSNGSKTPVSAAKGVCREAQSAQGVAGCVAEIAIPLTSLGNIKSGDLLHFNAIVEGSGVNDTFTFATVDAPSSWMKIRFK